MDRVSSSNFEELSKWVCNWRACGTSTAAARRRHTRLTTTLLRKQHLHHRARELQLGLRDSQLHLLGVRGDRRLARRQ